MKEKNKFKKIIIFSIILGIFLTILSLLSSTKTEYDMTKRWFPFHWLSSICAGSYCMPPNIAFSSLVIDLIFWSALSFTGLFIYFSKNEL